MHEASKAALRRIHDPNFAARYFVGDALDIGAGPDGLSKQQYLWPRLTTVVDWDLPDGDAQLLAFGEAVRWSTDLRGVLLTQTRGTEDAALYGFDVVHSSHCLEHMVDARAALVRWFEVVRPGGYLVTLVPDEDLYEQGVWPSTFNSDHKWTFTPWKPKSWSPVSINVLDLVALLGASAELVQLQRLERTWNPHGLGLLRWDRTSTPLGESAIEFVIRKRV